MENKTNSLESRIVRNRFGGASAGREDLRHRIAACSTVFAPTAETQDELALGGEE